MGTTEKLVKVIDELPADQQTRLLDFAMGMSMACKKKEQKDDNKDIELNKGISE